MPILNRINGSRRHIHFVTLMLCLALIFGIILTYHDDVQIWALALPLVLLLVWRSNLITLLLITIIVFFGDWLIGLGVLPEQFMWVHEILLVLIFLKALINRILMKKHIIFTGGWIFLAFMIVCMISLYMNYSGFLNLFLFLRLSLLSYFLFLAVVNLDMKEKEIKTYLYVVLTLIIIQLPVAIVKMFIYGQGEQAIGTYDYHGGTLSTALPLIVIGFGLSFFLAYKRSLSFIMLILGAIAFAIIGGKRGFIFFLPVMIIFLSWYLKDDIRYLFKYAVITGGIFLVALYFALSLVPTLSPERGLKSQLDPSYAVSFATDYTIKQQRGLSWGRTSTNINVFTNLYNRGALVFLFGRGPGSVMKSRFETYDTRNRVMDEFNIGYGITGMSWLAMNVGYLGVFLIFMLIFIILRRCSAHFHKEKNAFWRSFGLSMAVFSFVMLIINFAYAPLLLVDLISIHYFSFSAIVIFRERMERV